ncbi:hypothetical protein RCZ04_15440 [Capnocytophaga sp. HP1101]
MLFGIIDAVATLGIVIKFLLFTLLFWFILAQSVKRSHDLGQSGWYILLPFYNPFFLLFSEGVSGKNEYGEDPKKRINFFNVTTSTSFTSQSPLDRTYHPISNYTSESITFDKYDFIVTKEDTILKKWLDTEVDSIKMLADPILNKVSIIDRDVFYGCNKLTHIIFPKQLNLIIDFALDDCECLCSVTFSSEHLRIGNCIFGKSCPESIILEAKEPPVLDGYLAYSDEKLKAIYVPIELVEKYKIAKGWNKYVGVIQGY